MIAAMLPPSSGTITVAGFDVVAERAGVRELIGYMPQRFGLYQDLSVAENLHFFMDIYGITGAERERRRERYLGFSNLLPFLDRRAGHLRRHEAEAGARLRWCTSPVAIRRAHQRWTCVAAGILADSGGRSRPRPSGVDRLSRRRNVPPAADAQGPIRADGPAEVRAGFASLEEAMIQRIRAVDAALTEAAFGR
jgi:ABC-2 type transport system ATP-binding protein